MAHAPALAAPKPNRPAKFTMPSSPSCSSSSSAPTQDNSASDDDDNINEDTPLPFPTALPRTDFLAPNFSAAEYLSALSPHRHQTLEDLRSDLRERSAAISAELLELVNANYAAFLGLGDELHGGEDRVEDVRVAILGFRRAVDEVRGKVRSRGVEVAGLNAELGGVREEIELGRKMIEFEERVAALEGRLAIGSLAGGGRGGRGGGRESDESESEEEDDEEEDEDDEGEGEAVGGSVLKLTQLASDYVAADELADTIGREAPLVRKIEERMIRCRNTLLLDLNAALKEARKAEPSGQARLLRLMGVYVTLDAQGEALKALKGK
ncbi:oligomeric golgi complex component, COG2-domain-containing protein [Xylaria arbuscula]|nr:oligomeric golgi complex component, COG2-domain-containing protein [Xylaria arbuscula]